MLRKILFLKISNLMQLKDELCGSHFELSIHFFISHWKTGFLLFLYNFPAYYFPTCYFLLLFLRGQVVEEVLLYNTGYICVRH